MEVEDETPAAAAPKAAVAAPPHPDSLRGKRFVTMGEFNRGKFRVESAISDCGGVLTKSVTKTVAYVVCGRAQATQYGGVSGPGSKMHREAKKLKLTIVDEEGFQKLIDAHKAAENAALQHVADGLIPDLANIVADYASGHAPESGELGAVFLDICRLRGLDLPANIGATNASIERVEGALRLALPSDLKSLLRVQDGSDIFGDHPSYLFPSLGTLASRNTHGLASTFREKGLKYLGLGEVEQNTEELLDLRNRQLIQISTEPDMDGIWCVANGLRERMETYRTVVKIKLADYEDRLKHAQQKDTSCTERGYLRARASASWLAAQPEVPAAAAAAAAAAGAEDVEAARLAHEAREVRELRGLQTLVEASELRGPHAQCIAAHQLWLDDRCKARKEHMSNGVATDAAAAAAAAPSSSSAALSAAECGGEVQCDAAFPPFPRETLNKMWKIINKHFGMDD
jgi:hypothetical protein